jgi:hypothetical protein
MGWILYSDWKISVYQLTDWQQNIFKLKVYPRLHERNVPVDFLQHKVPKIFESNLRPVDCLKNPKLEWCPPGHGYVYPSLVDCESLSTKGDFRFENGVTLEGGATLLNDMGETYEIGNRRIIPGEIRV